MGFYVIATCSADLNIKIEEFLKKKIDHLLKKAGASNIKFFDFSVDFELGGNKGADFSVLDKIKELLNKEKCNFTITANEFVESDSGGYYYDSEDEEE